MSPPRSPDAPSSSSAAQANRKKSPPSPQKEQTTVDLVNPEKGQNAASESPRLPHERDQSSDAADSPPDPQVEQAFKDVQRGLQDTDRGPAADKAYRKLKDS